MLPLDGGSFLPRLSLSQQFRPIQKTLQIVTSAEVLVREPCIFGLAAEPLTLVPLPSQEEFEKALVWYESTLKLQPEFVPAKNRIQTIQCHLMLKKGRRSP